MFSVGEYIVYGVEGVCRVEEAGKLKVAGLDKNRAYYRLRPYYHDGTIYTPVDGKAVMRPVLTREELERLLPRLTELEPLGDVPPDSRAAGEYYRAILSGHDCVALLRLCKTLHAKQNSQTASRRGVNSTELRSWRMAEEMRLRGVRLCAWTSTCAGAGLSARKAGRIRLSAARGALRYTQVLCRSSRRAGLRRPASAHACAAQSPRDPYDRQPRRSP